MKSNLKQHITSLVRDIIPLGAPGRYSAATTSSTCPVPNPPPQETLKKHVCTLDTLNPLPKHMLPLKSPVLEHRCTSAVTSPSSSKKSSEENQERLSNYNVPMMKLQANNNSNQGSKEGSSAKKHPITQKNNSYNREREFASTLCKELNKNLKDGNGRLESWSCLQPQKPASSSAASRPESLSSSEPQRVSRSPGSGAKQHSQPSAGKVLNTDHSSPFLSPVSSHRGDRMPCLVATAAGSKLSLKRKRDSSSEREEEGKRLCQKDVRLTPLSASFNSSQGSCSISSPPKFIKRAFLMQSSEPVLLLKEKCSPVSSGHGGNSAKTSGSLTTCLPRQLFREPSREPMSETFTVHSKAPTKDLGTVNLLDDMNRSGECEAQVSNSQTLQDPSISSKLAQEYSDQSHSSSNSHSSHGLTRDFKVTSPSHESDTDASSMSLTAAWKDNSRKSDLVTSLKDSLPSPTARQNEKEKKAPAWKDPLDLELNEDGSLGLESSVLSLSSSDSRSSSSEEEHLLSLKEIMCRSACMPTTPEKETFSESSTPIRETSSGDVKKQPITYKNTLEQMLKEKEQNLKLKELEMQIQVCKEDLVKLDEEDDSKNAEETLSYEQREFLQRFSVTSCGIRDIHPGEDVFTLANFGRIFDHQNLDLRKISVTPNSKAQQSLLQAHPEQVVLLLGAGLLRRAYSSSPCQPEVTHWFFKMMSVHPSPSTCSLILQNITTLALSAAQQIVEKNKMFQVWVPRVQDVAVIFLNMGASFVSLFPLEVLQPPFTEGDLLESLEIQPDGKRTEEEPNSFPEHNFECIIKYLALCAALCPKVYTDEELLLLLTVVCRVSLETRLQLLPPGDISCLLEHFLNNITHWETQFPEVCQAVAALSDDHHNLRRLVQLLPYSERGKQLRRHLSLSVISKLLNGKCTYKPLCTEFQLSDLRKYMPRMRPSFLLKSFMAAEKAGEREAEHSDTTPDQQAYYLCYSLLALTNEASNFEFLPSKQRNELLLLSSALEKYIKCDIRENEKMLYRSKVKDFVARIYTKWQVLLLRSRPQEGKLYDYWKPPEDEVAVNQDSLSTVHLKEEPSEEMQSEDSDSSESKEEEWVEEEDELPIKTMVEVNQSPNETEEKNEELQEILCDLEEKGLNDQDGEEEETSHVSVEEELLGESPDDLTDDDLASREEELLGEDGLI